eukprot:10422794-Heterocapsa_arctica.AAC.1
MSNAEQKRAGFSQENVFNPVPLTVHDETPIGTLEQVAIDFVEAGTGKLGNRTGVHTERGRVNVQGIGQGMLACARRVLVIESPAFRDPPPSAGALHTHIPFKHAISILGRVAYKDDGVPSKRRLRAHERERRSAATPDGQRARWPRD